MPTPTVPVVAGAAEPRRASASRHPRRLRAARARREREGGIALLLVLLLMMILIPFATEYAYQVQLESRTAQNVVDQLMIENALDGQLEILLARLRRDAKVDPDTDTYHDEWNADEVLERNEDEVGVSLSTVVFDEHSKFNLRLLAQGTDDKKALNRQRLARLISEYRRDTKFAIGEGEAEEWAERIYDYANGARRPDLPVPKTQDGRTMLILEELTFVEPPSENRVEQILYDVRDEDDVGPGLHRYLTVHGDGKLNLNTADVRVLRAYFWRNPEIAEAIVERREGTPEEEEGVRQPARDEDEEEQQGNPFTEVAQIMEIEGVTQPVLQANGVDTNADFSVKSNVFGFRVLGTTDLTGRQEFFVVERVPAANPEDPLEGFRFHLRQERTDPLEKLPLWR